MWRCNAITPQMPCYEVVSGFKSKNSEQLAQEMTDYSQFKLLHASWPCFALDNIQRWTFKSHKTTQKATFSHRTLSEIPHKGQSQDWQWCHSCRNVMEMTVTDVGGGGPRGQ